MPIDVRTEVILEHLIELFRLSIGLRMEGSRKTTSSTYDPAQR